MKNKFVIMISLVTMILLVACERKPSATDEVTRYTAAADFIFRGTIQVLNTSTIDIEDITGMAVVKVDKVLSATDNLRDFEGQQITVRLKDLSTAKENESRIFFTKTFWYGESLGVEEVGSFAEGKLDNAEKQIEMAKQVNLDEKLKTRLATTELVVSGKVVSVKPAQKQYTKVTEHNPMWYEAEIEVASTLKGTETKKITVLFASSTDESFMESPKYKEGDEGIFLLRKNNTRMGDEDMYSIVSKHDFLAPDQAERIRSLIKK